jgi:tRNA G18 (ribose-2'-O)-methylase SpoU
MTADQVYGRRAVREALRGRREVLELWATERALGAEPWLQENGGPRPGQVRARASEAAGTRDHQGVVAKVAPYQYADACQLAQGRARCSSASTA